MLYQYQSQVCSLHYKLYMMNLILTYEAKNIIEFYD